MRERRVVESATAPAAARGALAPRTASLHQVALGLVAPPRRGCTREYSFPELPAFVGLTPLREGPVLAAGARTVTIGREYSDRSRSSNHDLRSTTVVPRGPLERKEALRPSTAPLAAARGPRAAALSRRRRTTAPPNTPGCIPAEEAPRGGAEPGGATPSAERGPRAQRRARSPTHVRAPRATEGAVADSQPLGRAPTSRAGPLRRLGPRGGRRGASRGPCRPLGRSRGGRRRRRRRLGLPRGPSRPL